MLDRGSLEVEAKLTDPLGEQGFDVRRCRLEPWHRLDASPDRRAGQSCMRGFTTAARSCGHAGRYFAARHQNAVPALTLLTSAQDTTITKQQAFTIIKRAIGELNAARSASA